MPSTSRNWLMQAMQQQRLAQMSHQPQAQAPNALRNLLNDASKLEQRMYDRSMIHKAMKDAVTAPGRAYRGEIDALGDPRGAMEEAMNTAGMAQLGGIPGGARGPGSVGMFIGPRAKTWNAAKNAEALKMEAAGVDPRLIWGETGNWKAPDGMWRQEIPDNSMFYRGSKAAGSSYAKDVVPHPSLYDAYPGLGNTRVREFTGTGGSFDGTNTMHIGTGGGGSSTSVHELQHAIQDREGFARGGSPGGMAMEGQRALTELEGYNKAMSSLARQMDKAKARGDAQTLETLRTQYDEIMNAKLSINSLILDDPYQAYHHLAGEAEARATQARMNMDMPERLRTFPADSYDVPLDQLIVRHGDGPAMNAKSAAPWAIPASVLGLMFSTDEAEASPLFRQLMDSIDAPGEVQNRTTAVAGIRG